MPVCFKSSKPIQIGPVYADALNAKAAMQAAQWLNLLN